MFLAKFKKLSHTHKLLEFKFLKRYNQNSLYFHKPSYRLQFHNGKMKIFESNFPANFDIYKMVFTGVYYFTMYNVVIQLYLCAHGAFFGFVLYAVILYYLVVYLPNFKLAMEILRPKMVSKIYLL